MLLCDAFAQSLIGDTYSHGCASSTSAGFMAMGVTTDNTQNNTIDTFLFASDTAVSNIGTLSRNGRDIADAHV